MDLNAKPASQGGQQTIGVRGKALFTAEIGWWRYVFQHPARVIGPILVVPAGKEWTYASNAPHHLPAEAGEARCSRSGACGCWTAGIPSRGCSLLRPRVRDGPGNKTLRQVCKRQFPARFRERSTSPSVAWRQDQARRVVQTFTDHLRQEDLLPLGV